MKSYADDLPNEEQKKRDPLIVLLLCLNLVVGVVNLIIATS